MNKNPESVIGLGLESSCDETSASVVAGGRTVRSNVVYSQIKLHEKYFGVVPEIASRAHLEKINGVIDSALKEAGLSFGDLDYVAATNRPGLVGSLLIALQSAKAVSFALGIPMIAVNHLEAHLYAPFLEGRSPEYPFIGLLISGGNTAMYLVKGTGSMELLGRTADDAVGEAFDKVAKLLGMGYPGGPLIEKAASRAVVKRNFLPAIMTKGGDNRFSYSGIKTAVVNFCRENSEIDTNEVAYSFQERALEILVRRVFPAARERNIKNIVVAGGVAANGRLRQMLNSGRNKDEKIILPSPALCTDNAAMVAGLGYHYFIRNEFDDFSTDVHGKVISGVTHAGKKSESI